MARPVPELPARPHMPTLRQVDFMFQEIPGHEIRASGKTPCYAAMVERQDILAHWNHPEGASPANEAIATDFRKTVDRDSDWAGGGPDAMRQALTKGWPEGRTQMAQVLREITRTVTPTTLRLQARRHWEGDVLLLDEYQRGNYDTMWHQYRRKGGVGPGVIHIAFAWGGNCNMTTGQLFWSGAVACLLSDVLEDAGYSTEIVAWTPIWSYNDGSHYSLIGFTVKEPDGNLLPDAIAAMSAHPAVFRCGGIALGELSPRFIGYGHGSHFNEPYALLQAVARETEWFEPPEIVINSVWDQETSIDELHRLLTRVELLRLYRTGVIDQMPWPGEETTVPDLESLPF